MSHIDNNAVSARPKQSHATPERLFYLDNLRALAMFAGVFFHAALAYSPLMHELWFSADEQNSIVIDWIIYLLHLVRMPLFFLISGFFALMLIEKIKIGGFLRNRSRRILVPFIVFLPLVIISIMLTFGWAIENVTNQSSMLKIIALSASNPDIPQPPFSTIHLWFLFNLFLFCMVTALLAKLKFYQHKLLLNIFSAKRILIVLPFLMLPALLSQTVPHPAPDKIYPELWSFGFYGLFFLLGNLIYLQPNLLTQLTKLRFPLLLIGLLSYLGFYWLLPETITLESMMLAMEGQPLDGLHIVTVFLEVLVAICLTLCCLIFGKLWFNQDNRWIRLVADSSYWIYLMHIPLLFYIQFLLLDVAINMWIKLLISCSVTFVAGMLSYLLLVRYTPIGWMLNGRRKSV